MRSKFKMIKKIMLLSSLFVILLPLGNAYAFTTDQAATIVLGQPNFTHAGANDNNATGKNGTAGANTVDGSISLTFDSSGNLWVSDRANARVMMYPHASLGTNYAKATIVLGQPDFVHTYINNNNINTNGTVGADTLSGDLRDLKFDSSGNLWVEDDANNRIIEYTPPITTRESASSVVLGQPDLRHNAANNNLSGTNNTTTASASGLDEPLGMAFDSSGNMWVSDNLNNRVLEYTTPFSAHEAASIVLGQPDFAHNSVNNNAVGNGTDVSAKTLDSPVNLTFDASGNLWVVDATNRILEYTTPFSTHESASIVLGQPDMLHSAANNNNINTNGTAGTKTLSDPRNVSFDSSGNLYVTDANNARVLFYPKSSLTSNYPAATVVLGQSSFTVGTVASPPTSTSLSLPHGLQIDPKSNLWVEDFSNNRIIMYPTTYPTPSEILAPTATVSVTHNSTPSPSETQLPPMQSPYTSNDSPSQKLYLPPMQSPYTSKSTPSQRHYLPPTPYHLFIKTHSPSQKLWLPPMQSPYTSNSSHSQRLSAPSDAVSLHIKHSHSQRL